jgi:hypothetical protein
MFDHCVIPNEYMVSGEMSDVELMELGHNYGVGSGGEEINGEVKGT